jgi:uncharacterized membrane protein
MASTAVFRSMLFSARLTWMWFAIALALVGFGFWPSFFSALAVQQHAILIHGISATLWMALPIVQALLYRRHRTFHRRLGYASLALAAVVVISGLYVIQTMILTNSNPISLVSIKFVLLDLTGIALFVVFLYLAIRSARRHDVALHLRLMACTAIIPLEAANERTAILIMPGLAPDFGTALYASLLSMEAICVALVLAEWRLDRIRWPFSFMLGYYLVMHAIATPVAMSQQFQAFCLWYAKLGA